MKKVVDAKAVGYGILVEILTEQDVCGGLLIVSKEPSQQGIILDVGPLVDEKYGFKEGQRVLLQGTYTPTPVQGKNDRIVGVVDPHIIRAILVEEKE